MKKHDKTIEHHHFSSANHYIHPSSSIPRSRRLGRRFGRGLLALELRGGADHVAALVGGALGVLVPQHVLQRHRENVAGGITFSHWDVLKGIDMGGSMKFMPNLGVSINEESMEV